MYFAIQEAVDGFVWQIRDSGNHEILASSEILRTRETCLKAMRTVRSEARAQQDYWDRTKQKWISF
jgi:uncharacterized protein YegP (UPF0339 family)